MKYSIFFLFAVFFSCEKIETKQKTVITSHEKARSSDATVTPLKRDETIIYDNEGSFRFNAHGRLFDSIHLHLKVGDALRKGDTIRNFTLDFYRNGKICQTHELATEFRGEDKAWLFYEDFFNRDQSGKSSDNRFFNLTAGVPACGYGITNFLFFVNNGKAELFDTWVTAGEESYASDKVFFPKFTANQVTSLVSRYEDFEIFEDTINKTGKKKTIFSDSMHYKFDNAGIAKHIVKRGAYRIVIENHELEQTEE